MFEIYTQKPVTLYIVTRLCVQRFTISKVTEYGLADRQTDRQRDWYTDREADRWWPTGKQSVHVW